MSLLKHWRCCELFKTTNRQEDFAIFPKLYSKILTHTPTTVISGYQFVFWLLFKNYQYISFQLKGGMAKSGIKERIENGNTLQEQVENSEDYFQLIRESLILDLKVL